jgi:hypothetical protein
LDIEKKSIGFMIDELITTSMKCWYAQEGIMAHGSDEEIAKAAIKAQQLNARRNALIRAIDCRLGEFDITLTDKTYGV